MKWFKKDTTWDGCTIVCFSIDDFVDAKIQVMLARVRLLHKKVKGIVLSSKDTSNLNRTHLYNLFRFYLSIPFSVDEISFYFEKDTPLPNVDFLKNAIWHIPPYITSLSMDNCGLYRLGPDGVAQVLASVPRTVRCVDLRANRLSELIKAALNDLLTHGTPFDEGRCSDLLLVLKKNTRKYAVIYR